MKLELKSRTFSTGFFKGEQLDTFNEDIHNVIDFNQSSLEDVLNFVKRVSNTETEKEEQKLFTEAVESNLVGKRAEIISFYRLAKYFWEQFNKELTKSDEPKVIVQDISSSIDIEYEKLNVIEDFIGLVKNETQWYENQKLTLSTSAGLLPFLKGIGTTVEIRGVFTKQLSYGEKVEDYSNSLQLLSNTPTTPVITVALTVDTGTPDRFVFQASPTRIEWLIEELKASLIKLEVLNNYYNGK